MNYWLHPEAQGDLKDAAKFYQEQADTSLLEASGAAKWLPLSGARRIVRLLPVDSRRARFA